MRRSCKSEHNSQSEPSSAPEPNKVQERQARATRHAPALATKRFNFQLLNCNSLLGCGPGPLLAPAASHRRPPSANSDCQHETPPRPWGTPLKIPESKLYPYGSPCCTLRNHNHMRNTQRTQHTLRIPQRRKHPEVRWETPVVVHPHQNP